MCPSGPSLKKRDAKLVPQSPQAMEQGQGAGCWPALHGSWASQVSTASSPELKLTFEGRAPHAVICTTASKSKTCSSVSNSQAFSVNMTIPPAPDAGEHT